MTCQTELKVPGHHRLLPASFAASCAWWAPSAVACPAAGGQRWDQLYDATQGGVETCALQVAHLRETRKEQAEPKRDGSCRACVPRARLDRPPRGVVRRLYAQNHWWGILWSGDVWKAIVHPRSTRHDLRIAVLKCDFGVGIVRKGFPESQLSYSAPQIKALNYADLAAHRDRLLNPKPPRYLGEFLGENAKSPRKGSRAKCGLGESARGLPPLVPDRCQSPRRFRRLRFR